MPTRLTEILARLERAGRYMETTVLVIVLASLMLLAVGQIILREVFTYGFIWANELQNLMVLWLAMIAMIAACRDNRHIRIDALSRLLSPRLKRAARVLVDLFAAVVCGIIAWQIYRYLKLEGDFGDTVLVDTPAWLAHSIMPLAFLLTAYRFLVHAIRKAVGVGDDDDVGAVV